MLWRYFTMHLCLLLPWHKLKHVAWTVGDSEYVRCTCGREYGINDRVRSILPWEDVRTELKVKP